MRVLRLGPTVYSGDITVATAATHRDASDNRPNAFTRASARRQRRRTSTRRRWRRDPLPHNADTTTVCLAGDSDGDVTRWTTARPINPQQEDADGDDKGDACDDCAAPNPGNSACPTTIYEIKQGNVTGAVALDNVLVTGCAATRGYFVQHKLGDPDYTAPEYSGVFVYNPTVDCVAFAAGFCVIPPPPHAFFGGHYGSTATAVSTGEKAPAPSCSAGRGRRAANSTKRARARTTRS
jgi:hypothetical protein